MLIKWYESHLKRIFRDVQREDLELVEDLRNRTEQINRRLEGAEKWVKQQECEHPIEKKEYGFSPPKLLDPARAYLKCGDCHAVLNECDAHPEKASRLFGELNKEKAEHYAKLCGMVVVNES